MFDKTREGYFRIPSELLEDKLTAIMADWLSMYGREEIDWKELKTMMKGLWWFLMKNDATHSLVAWNNFDATLRRHYADGTLLTICKQVLAS